MIAQYIVVQIVVTLSAVVISFEIGCYLWQIELIKDAENDIDQTVKLGKNPLELLKRLPDSIQLHSYVKQLSKIVNMSNLIWRERVSNSSNRFSQTKFYFSYRIARDLGEIMQPFLTALFSWSIATICTTMLIGQMILVRCHPPFY